jgi:hypothetical protein
MSALGFALLFGNEDKQSWTQFWNFINSLTAIDGHDRQYFNELRSTVVSR